MPMTRSLIALCLFVLLAGPAAAQMPDTAAQRAEMAKLDFLLGSWLGQGWRIMPDGQRRETSHWVHVASKANGLVYTIEGRGVRQGDMAEKPSDGSIAVIGYDPAEEQYFFHSYTFGGLSLAEGELVSDKVFRWTTTGPVTIRFTVDVSAPGVWREIGEVATADGGWRQTYAMTHYRVDSL